jgi:hypothetical protein
MFFDELGCVRIIIESQSGWRPNYDMKMSSGPSVGVPGSHILGVVAQGLIKHKFTAKLGILLRNFGSCITLF